MKRLKTGIWRLSHRSLVPESVYQNVWDLISRMLTFKNNGITVVRKGGNEMVIYFGEEVEHALKQYLYTTREAATPLPGHENALIFIHAAPPYGSPGS